MSEPSRLPTTDAVVRALRELLPHLPLRVVAGIVYGSVATGRHHRGSDVDALLISDRTPSTEARVVAAELYRSFQIALGFEPDERYPVELFGVDECRQVIGAIASMGRAEHTITPEPAGLSPEDAQEILHALVAPHRVVVGERLIDELRAAARRHLAQSVPRPHEKRSDVT